MIAAGRALAMARREAGEGAPQERVLINARDHLDSMLSTLDSKTSALLRFNAIVVAALAYLVVVRAADPFAGANTVIKAAGMFVGHLSLVASVVSCGFAFPVIGIGREFLGALPGEDRGRPLPDEGEIEALGKVVERRVTLYRWAWRLAVTGGTGFAVLVALATIH